MGFNIELDELGVPMRLHIYIYVTAEIPEPMLSHVLLMHSKFVDREIYFQVVAADLDSSIVYSLCRKLSFQYDELRNVLEIFMRKSL